MAGMSKNSRVSRRTTTTGFVRAADSARIIPLNAGHAYVFTATGKTLRVKVASEAFITAISEVAAVDGDERIVRELTALHQADQAAGWDAALTAFEAARAAKEDEAAA